MKSFAEQLREARNDRGISQEVLAKRSGVSYRTIERMESGKGEPSVSTLIKLVREFHGHQFLFEDGFYDVLIQAKRRKR